MKSIFKILEFSRILEELALKANTLQAKEQIENLCPVLNENELRRSLRETSQARTMLDLIGTPPIPLMEHVEENLEKAVKGDMLIPGELEDMGSFLTAVKRMNEYLERGKIHQISLSYYNENLIMLHEINEEIGRCIRGGRVDDYATGELKDIRSRLTYLENKMQEKAENLLRTQKAYLSDHFVVKRNGHTCIPVKKEYKSRIQGSVIDKSSSGSTLFIEPLAVAALSEELELCRIEEDCEVRKILYTLTGLIADQEKALRQNLNTIVKLDFAFAKGKLSADMQAVCPFINTEGVIRLKAARHPMLPRDSCVPLDIILGQEEDGIRKRGVVITGPNTGGKTVAMKTVGIFSLMACSGLHVPCEEADISMQNQILCDIGDGQDITDNLSTFSAHISNVVGILQKVTRESLVILDELGSGTDPAEGMGIGIAILEELRKSGCLYMVTTHYPEVKTYAGKHPEIQSASMAFDRQNLKPLYRLELGKSGDSCALYIAKRLGLPDYMLETAAREAYGANSREMLRLIGVNPSGKNQFTRIAAPVLEKKPQKPRRTDMVCLLKRGDSVTVMPEETIGIVVKAADNQGNVLVQVKKEKLLVNHKRLKLKVEAEELYPEDYDFSILFDTVENRKARHKMGKKHQENVAINVWE